MDLAPGLNLAQPFIEALASNLSLRNAIEKNDSQLLYQVIDKNLASRKHPYYFLTISKKKGNLCFEASTSIDDGISTSMSQSNNSNSIDLIEIEIKAIAKSWSIELGSIEPQFS